MVSDRSIDHHHLFGLKANACLGIRENYYNVILLKLVLKDDEGILSKRGEGRN